MNGISYASTPPGRKPGRLSRKPYLFVFCRRNERQGGRYPSHASSVLNQLAAATNGTQGYGATPSARLKERLKWAASEKPAACAASVSDAFPETMAAAARCSRNQER